MAQKIELQKIRDFGDIITDTFIFIRQNLKPLITCFFIFCGFFLIGSIIFSTIQEAKAVNLFNGFNAEQPDFDLFRNSIFSLFGVEYLLNVIFLIFNYTAINVTVFSFLCLYKEKGNVPPTPEEVWGYFKFFYFKILGSGILLAILLIVGALLCIIPGIYLYPVLSLVFPIMIFENTSFGYAFNRSFRLIKDNWWITFGTIIIIGLIIYFADVAVLLPLTLINLSSFFVHPKGGLHLSSTVTTITTILQHLCLVFYIVPLVTISLIYYSLAEKLDATGLIGRIDKLGANGPDNSLSKEEY